MGVTAQQPQQITDHVNNNNNNNSNPTTKVEANNNVLKHNTINLHTLNGCNAQFPSCCGNVDDLTISEFYRDTHVLITGGTGFLGKAVVEKLLRTCDLIHTIYIVIRSKRGMNAAQRLQELFKNPVFDKIKEKDESLLLKVRPIEGDVSLPNLGIAEADRRHLIEHVDVVIHSAATVRFTEPLKIAVILNTIGTKKMLELALELKKLKSFVHVSTAYSNSDRNDVDEIVYDPPADPYHMIKCVETLPDEAIQKLEKEVVTKHPNTYTFTKAMAEALVQEYSARLPIAIVRPSIVTNSWKEPFGGWIDHATGIVGVMMEIGRGGIQSVIGKKDAIIDIVPVDIVSNTLIVAAWHTVAKRSNSLRVYNCTSGQINKMEWGTWGQLTIQSALKFPTKYLSWYPQLTYRTNRFLHFLHVLLLQRGPACMADIMLMCQRRKPVMYNFAKKVERNVKVGEYFALRDFNFDVTNLERLKHDVRVTSDGENFNLDMSKKHFEWAAYNEQCMVGIRQLVLKDDLSSLPQARRTLNRFYWLKKALQLLSIYIFLKMTIF